MHLSWVSISDYRLLFIFWRITFLSFELEHSFEWKHEIFLKYEAEYEVAT